MKAKSFATLIDVYPGEGTAHQDWLIENLHRALAVANQIGPGTKVHVSFSIVTKAGEPVVRETE